MADPLKLTELAVLPSPLQAGDLVYVVRNGTDYQAQILSAAQSNAADFLAANAQAADVNVAGTAIAAALAAKLGINAQAADVNVSGTAIAAALSAKLGTSAQAADVNVAGTAIAAALSNKADASSIPAADGWTAAGETWTYASASSFTVSGDVTSKYAKGDRVKLTQTTAKFFFIVGVSHAAGTSTVTVAGGSDYSLANAAIASPYFSKASSPADFPQWFALSCGFTGFSSNPSGFLARFTITGKTCFVKFRGPNSGTSNSTAFTITGAPVAAAATPANFSWLGYFWGIDNGTAQTQWLVIDPGTSTFVCARNGSGTGWTASGSKGLFVGEVVYEF